MRSAQAPGFIRGVSASETAACCAVLTQSGNNHSAAVDELGLRQVVLERIDQSVAPDGVVGVQQAPPATAGNSVIEAAVDARHETNARVVAAEVLRLKLCPHGVVGPPVESVPPEAVLKPVVATVVAPVRGRFWTRHAHACSAFRVPTNLAAGVVPAPRVFAARPALLERRIIKRRSAVVAGQRSGGGPFTSESRLPRRRTGAVLVGAWPTRPRGAVGSSLGSTVLTESFGDPPRLGCVICHLISIQPAEARRCSLRRWCETVPRLAREGNRR